jgi:HPt (histidine-containing phosphotransfer) domain-containing protein
MTGADEEFQAKLKALHDAYKDKLDARLDEIDTAIDNLRNAGGGNTGELNALLALAHKLTGSAGTFGLTGVSEVAGKLEALCESLVSEGTNASAEMDRIAGLAADIRKAAGKG